MCPNFLIEKPYNSSWPGAGYHDARWCQGRYRYPLTPPHRHDQRMIDQYAAQKTACFLARLCHLFR